MGGHESIHDGASLQYLACMGRILRKEWVRRIPWLLVASRTQSEGRNTGREVEEEPCPWPAAGDVIWAGDEWRRVLEMVLVLPEPWRCAVEEERERASLSFSSSLCSP